MIKAFLSLYLYIFSFSFLNSACIAYGLQSYQYFFHSIYIVPLLVFVLTTLFILANKARFFLEILLYCIATFWNCITVGHALLYQSEIEVGGLYAIFFREDGEMLTFAKTFFSFNLLIIFIILICVPLLFWVLSHKFHHKWTYKEQGVLLLCSAVCTTSLLFNFKSDPLQPFMRLANIEGTFRKKLFYIKT